MKVTLKTAALVAAAILLGTASEAWSVSTVSGVTMTQREGTRLVDISYTLEGEDAIVTLSIETNNVAIPDSNVTWLTGDVCKLIKQGSRTITWNAGDDWPENVSEFAKARVTAWCVNAPPECCVVDLRGGASTNTYPVNYYTSVEALPFGGLSNVIYKSSYLVMRKIAKGTFNFGEGVPPSAVNLTQDFYAGVFQVTQGQWFQVMGTTPAYLNDTTSRAFRPVEKMSYYLIRENNNNTHDAAVNWPANDVVTAGSFMGRIRSRTGLGGFDLPTEAQWEYTCRAGTITYYSDGLETPDNITNNVQMNVLGRYAWNGGKINGITNPTSGYGPEHGTAIVGSYLPNNWGLYDMHGNVWEWCLDRAGALPSGTDPKGATSGVNFVRRGGCYLDTAGECRTARRYANAADLVSISIGFRLFRTLP